MTLLGIQISLSSFTRYSPLGNGVWRAALNSCTESSRLAVFKNTNVLPSPALLDDFCREGFLWAHRYGVVTGSLVAEVIVHNWREVFRISLR